MKKGSGFLCCAKPLGASFTRLSLASGSTSWGPYSSNAYLVGLYLTPKKITLPLQDTQAHSSTFTAEVIVMSIEHFIHIIYLLNISSKFFIYIKKISKFILLCWMIIYFGRY